MDLFAGAFDSLRGFSDSIGTFFNRGSSMNDAQTANLIASGWDSATAGGSGGSKDSGLGMFASAVGEASKVASSAFQSQDSGSSRVSLSEGMINQDGRVSAGRVGTLDSRSPAEYEQMILQRLSKFARLDSYVGQSKGK